MTATRGQVERERHFVSGSPQETIELGRRIGAQLRGGEVIALSGPLGSGKTHLIKGIAAGAGAEDMGRITSPTFVIVNQYSGRLQIYHVDAFRLASAAELEMIGFDELCGPGSIVLIEWADKVEAALKGMQPIIVRISHRGPSERVISISSVPGYLKF